MACDQQATDKIRTTAADSTAGHSVANTLADDSIPPEAVKSDNYYRESYKEIVKELSNEIRSFVPEGYAALDTATGDLNLDAYSDLLLVLAKRGEDTSSDVVADPEKRPLLILTGQPDKTYKLAAKNENAVYCIDCGGVIGDPFMGLSIKNGYFSVEHYGGSAWRWTRIITFKYSLSDSTWYLHKDGGDSFHASEPEKVTTKVYTVKDFGKVPFMQFDIYNKESE